MELLTTLFPGIGSMLAQEPAIAAARLVLIVIGFILAYMGFTRKLEPLIMVPMGLGMICVNAGVLFLSDGSIGTLLLELAAQAGATLVVVSHDARLTARLTLTPH